MYVQPALGLKVHDPDRNDFIPADGRDVEPNQYWLRRVVDGDVVHATPTPPTQPQLLKEPK